jgi:hypothetical protein
MIEQSCSPHGSQEVGGREGEREREKERERGTERESEKERERRKGQYSNITSQDVSPMI